MSDTEKLMTLKESNDPANYVAAKKPCARCSSTDWSWRAGTFAPFPNTCSECPSEVDMLLDIVADKIDREIMGLQSPSTPIGG